MCGPAGVHLPHSGAGHRGRGALQHRPGGAVHAAEVSGAAKVHFQVKEKISLHTSGAAKATYSGDPIILSLHSSGASNINKISSKLLENKKEYEK